VSSVQIGAGEDHIHVVTLTTIKTANDPQLLPYPPKEEWWAMSMAKSQISVVHPVHIVMSQGLQH